MEGPNNFFLQLLGEGGGRTNFTFDIFNLILYKWATVRTVYTDRV